MELNGDEAYLRIGLMAEPDEQLIETAKRWVETQYEGYPDGVRGFDRRDFWPSPTIILEEPLDIDIMQKVIENHGFESETKKPDTGNRLVAACYTNSDRTEVVYSFADTRELNLDSPRRYNECPENGRVALIVDYLERKHA